MLLRILDCAHIDADEVCRQLLEPHAEGWQEFSRVFGLEYFTEEGRINRSLLRKNLFADEDFRRKVNNVIHPMVKRKIVAQMDHIIESSTSSRVLVEVPLLFEVQWENLFDTVIVVYADYETCLKRLMERDGLERGAAVRTLESQLPLPDKVMKADHVIDNSGMLQDSENQVEHLAGVMKRSNGCNSPGEPEK
jgi:dephospho-CoA kinase